MYVSDNFDRRTQLDECRLTEEDLTRDRAHAGDFCILERWALGDLAAVSRLEQSADHIVEVHGRDARPARHAPSANGGTERRAWRERCDGLAGHVAGREG